MAASLMDILWILVGAKGYTEALGGACEYIIFLTYPQQGTQTLQDLSDC